MRPRAVFLDAGGTLFSERVSRDEMYRRAIADRGHVVGAGLVRHARALVDAGMPETVSGRIRYSDVWFNEYVRRVLVALRIEADAEDLRVDLARRFREAAAFAVHPDVELALTRLQTAGLRLAVVSNWSVQLTGLLEELGLARWFDAIVASEAVESSKPAPRIFREALGRVDVSADEAVHVGDHLLNDVEGAAAAGLTGILLDRAGTRPRSPGVVHSLLELPERLGLPHDGRHRGPAPRARR